jgi:cytochrome c oxidase subunit II
MVSRYEVAWTLAVVGLLAGVAAYSAVLLYNVDALSPSPGEYVDVTGHQWFWEFYYPANHTDFNSTYIAPTNASGGLGTVTGGALWARPGEVVQVNVTSGDVVHSFNIPSLGVRIDAIPGRMNYFQFTVPLVTPGTEYLIQCTEFCGTFHGTMRSFLVVT